jgi:hypothetical protein
MLSEKSTKSRYDSRVWWCFVSILAALQVIISGCEGTEIIAELNGGAGASDVNGGDPLGSNLDELPGESLEDDTEWDVQQSSHDCGVSIIEDDAEVNNAYELELLRDYTYIAGNLTIGGERNDDIWNLFALSNLLCVDGDIIIENNDRLGSIWGLSSLKRIEGDIRIVHNESLQTRDAIEFIDFIRLAPYRENDSEKREWNGQPCVYGNLYGGWEDDWYQSGCDRL